MERERYNSDRRREKMECGGREKKKATDSKTEKKDRKRLIHRERGRVMGRGCERSWRGGSWREAGATEHQMLRCPEFPPLLCCPKPSFLHHLLTWLTGAGNVSRVEMFALPGPATCHALPTTPSASQCQAPNAGGRQPQLTWASLAA